MGEYTCGLDAAIAVMGGRWKGLILFDREVYQHMERIDAVP